MTSGVVRSTIAEVLENKDLTIQSPRIANAKFLAQDLLEKAVECERNMDKFDMFASKLMNILQAACKEDKAEVAQHKEEEALDKIPQSQVEYYSTFVDFNDDRHRSEE